MMMYINLVLICPLFTFQQRDGSLFKFIIKQNKHSKE